MKIAIACALAFPVILPADCTSAPAQGTECVLENASARLVLQDNRIVSLFDKIRSIEHVSPQADSTAGMFRIHYGFSIHGKVAKP